MQQEADTPEKPARSNVPELTVTELSYSLKKTLEETFGRVRVRGELSRVKVHTSGHMYSDLKDDSACLSIVCWKSQMGRLKIKPEEGLEVICTGRVSSYPARSSYQLIIESMELAGEGALLKLLEDRRKKLAAEGLFDAVRKKALPFLPDVIGVVTSPTGAVIRDIMHRLDDRFPRHVLLWPVLVQGDGAAAQIAAAIRGFDALPVDGPVPRPDILIVARGGGSLEDLMAFNEEIVVRAAAECSIPLISAVGHETDTTLIDHAADRRAPTPTAAAEMAVPRRIDIWHGIQECLQRLSRHATRCLEVYTDRLESCAARLGDPARLLEMRDQRLDHLTEKLRSGFERKLEGKKAAAGQQGARLVDPRRLVELKGQALDHWSHKLEAGFQKRLGLYDHEVQRQYLRPPQIVIEKKERDLHYISTPLKRLAEKGMREGRQSLAYYDRMLENLSFKNVLKRGYIVVSDEQGKIVTEAGQTRTGQNVQLLFKDDRKVAAVVTGKGEKPASKPKKTPKVRQEELF